ncbi:hypothetical protein BDK92_2978 [Micromonospora pisi]|uniref:Excreted virulence factor EspC (Type VII ESX diderm) n=1 Tax=Micromonospora pisi TaxID=589240 RepID=A0A495JKU6_9ACTN|nr:hypothetical protein [Micromonospora pisi]RKR88649.1 hypothetical protein BDK92_2978 [Micromonospora pisi]
MTSVGEVKAGLTRFNDEATRQAATIRSLAESMDRTSAMLRGLTSGASAAQVAEALVRLEQAKQRLHEAATLAQGAVEATDSYAAGF